MFHVGLPNRFEVHYLASPRDQRHRARNLLFRDEFMHPLGNASQNARAHPNLGRFAGRRRDLRPAVRRNDLHGDDSSQNQEARRDSYVV